jgi:osmoprotectant transport system ATP-binding protein
VLLLDGERRPIGWVNTLRLAPDGSLGEADTDPSSPIFPPETTLRDALSMLLATSVQTGVLVEEDGRYRGVLTLEAVAAALRGEAPV